MKPKRIISGGQTGADRAALDFALAEKIETGGFVPRGRRAEDGRIPERYANLRETRSADYAARTGRNVEMADATLIVSDGPLKGGSALTKERAKSFGKPCLHVDLAETDIARAAEQAAAWLGRIGCRTLNVAGPRLSEDAGIYVKTKKFLELLFARVK